MDLIEKMKCLKMAAEWHKIEHRIAASKKLKTAELIDFFSGSQNCWHARDCLQRN